MRRRLSNVFFWLANAIVALVIPAPRPGGRSSPDLPENYSTQQQQAQEDQRETAKPRDVVSGGITGSAT